MRLILTVSLLGACGSVEGMSDPKPDAAIDQLQADAAVAVDALVLGAFGAPEVLAELTEASDPEVSVDGTEIVFTSGRAGGLGSNDIWMGRRTGTSGPFGSFVPVTEINSDGSEIHPTLSPDALRMYFASSRTGNYDLYITARATRTSPWAPPTLVAEFNSSAVEYRVSLSTDGLIALVDSTRTGAVRGLHLSTRASTSSAWTTPQFVGQLGTCGNGSLSSDGLAVYCMGSEAQAELYVARRVDRNSSFGALVPLGELNSTAHDSDPWISPDERTIMFSSLRSGTDGIYRATR